MDGEAIVELARRQFGVVSVEQAREAGLSAEQIRRRVERGAWIRVLPGVIRAAWADDGFRARCLATWLWAGPDALVSHEAAGVLWGIVEERSAEVVVSTPYHLRPVADWVRLFETSPLPRWVRRVRDSIPVTSPARTLMDLAARPALDIEAMWVSLVRRELISTRELQRLIVLGPSRGKAGIARLRAMLRRPEWVDGDLERPALALFKRHKLPTPRCQYPVEGVGFVDFAWPEARLLIETDGFATHSGREAWQRDLARQNALVTSGWTVLRMTWEDVHSNGDMFIHRIRRLLHRSSAQKRLGMPELRETS